jgi:hypothetical protein
MAEAAGGGGTSAGIDEDLQVREGEVLHEAVVCWDCRFDGVL